MGILDQLKPKPKDGAFDMPLSVWRVLHSNLFMTGHYAQDALRALEPFALFRVKVSKQTKRNMPSGWEVDPTGAVIMGERKELLATVDARRMAENGIETGKSYLAFVIPPCSDLREGVRIEDEYTLAIMPRDML